MLHVHIQHSHVILLTHECQVNVPKLLYITLLSRIIGRQIRPMYLYAHHMCVHTLITSTHLFCWRRVMRIINCFVQTIVVLIELGEEMGVAHSLLLALLASSSCCVREPTVLCIPLSHHSIYSNSEKQLQPRHTASIATRSGRHCDHTARKRRLVLWLHKQVSTTKHIVSATTTLMC